LLRAATPDRPNVLFFFCDDQRADTIAALGNPNIKTPNLDRLTQRGVAFRRAYMMGGMQGATCVPSRAMLLTGQSLFHIDEKLMRDETWPAAFGRAGYETFLSGKWHNGAPSIAKSFQRARSILDHYFFLVNAKKQNEEFEKEVAFLRTKVAQLQEVELENARLRSALQFRDTVDQKLLPAHVVAHDVSND
jgi:arylsulfatase A-like enzyme